MQHTFGISNYLMFRPNDWPLWTFEKKNYLKSHYLLTVLLRALSHLHVFTWRPEDVLGVHWKLPERVENVWLYLQTGFAATHRVVSGDLNTSALRHLTSLSRSYSVYPVLDAFLSRLPTSSCCVFGVRTTSSATPLRLHSVLGVFIAYEGDQTRSDDALSQHVTFCSKNNFAYFTKYLRSQRCHGWERKALSEREREGKEHLCIETSTKTNKRRCGCWVWRRISFHHENFRITGLCNGNLLTAKKQESQGDNKPEREYVSEGISHPVLYNDLVCKLRRVKCEANFVSSGSKIVKRLRCRKYDPMTMERTIGFVLGPFTALYKSFPKHCTLTYKAVWTIWRALSDPPQIRQSPDPHPLWLLVGTPSAFGPEIAYRLRVSTAYFNGCP